MAERKLQATIIGYGHIKERRATKQVPCGPRGVVADYVPTYFGPRSPMLYVINQGGNPEYTGGQSQVIHLVASTEGIQAAGVRFVFTDGHAVMAMTSFFEDLRDLNHIDWPLMTARYWNDTLEDPDRSRRRQAEFLVHRFLPWTEVQEVAVANEAIRQQAQESIAFAVHQPPVMVRPAWYY